jgi:tetratricopeptide (TPR) repeat protein
VKLRSNPQGTSEGKKIDISEPSEAQEIRWLKKRLQFDFPEDEANELMAILKSLPLPMAQIAPDQRGETAQLLATFLKNLRDEQTLIDLEPDQQDSQSTITKAIVELIQISLSEVDRLDHAAVRLLCFMSTLNNKAVPMILFTHFKTKESKTQIITQAVVAEPKASINPLRCFRPKRQIQPATPTTTCRSFEETLDILLEYSFITEDAGGKTYSMNKLVQQAATNWIEARFKTKYWHRWSTEILNLVFYGNKAELSGSFLGLILHVQAVILDEPVPKSLYDTCDAGEDRSYLLTRVGLLNEFASECTDHGLTELAEVAITEATEINAMLFPPHRSSTLWTQSRYGHFLNAQRNPTDGKLAEAEAKLREVVDSVDMAKDERDALPALLTSLGESLYQQARYDEAHEVFERAVNECEDTVGGTHSRSLNCLRNLAVNHTARHNYQTAEELQRRVFTTKEKTLGAQNVETLLSKSDLGRILQAGSKYTEALKIQREVSTSFKATLGANHSWTLLSLYRLATTLNLEGKNDEALTINTQVLVGRQKLYREDSHQAMVATIKQQAFILQALKRYDDAEVFFLRSEKSHVAAYGADHRRTTEVVNSLKAMRKERYEALSEKAADTKSLTEETIHGESDNEEGANPFGAGSEKTASVGGSDTSE